MTADKHEYASRLTKEECADELVDLWLYYPIFVKAGALYECSVSDRKVTYKRVHRVGFLHRGYEVAGIKSEDFRIDVVDPTGLRDLLKLIDSETEKIAEPVGRRYRALGKSRSELAKQFADMDKDKRIRTIAGIVKFEDEDLLPLRGPQKNAR